MVKPNEEQKRKKRPRLTAVTFLIFSHPPTPPNKNYRSPLAYASRGIGGVAPLNPHPSPGRQESRTSSALLLNRVFKGKVSRVRFAAILTRSLRPPLGASGLRLPVAPLTRESTEATEQKEFGVFCSTPTHEKTRQFPTTRTQWPPERRRRVFRGFQREGNPKGRG